MACILYTMTTYTALCAHPAFQKIARAAGAEDMTAENMFLLNLRAFNERYGDTLAAEDTEEWSNRYPDPFMRDRELDLNSFYGMYRVLCMIDFQVSDADFSAPGGWSIEKKTFYGLQLMIRTVAEMGLKAAKVDAVPEQYRAIVPGLRRG